MATMPTRTAAELRTHLRRELRDMGWCDVEVGSEFAWKATRRLARAVARSDGFAVRSHLHQASASAAWPRVLTIWDPEMQADPSELRRAASAHGLFLD
jgi:uncharacterized protein YraI